MERVERPVAFDMKDRNGDSRYAAQCRWQTGPVRRREAPVDRRDDVGRTRGDREKHVDPARADERPVVHSNYPAGRSPASATLQPPLEHLLQPPGRGRETNDLNTVERLAARQTRWLR